MRIKTLVAAKDKAYTGNFCEYISEHHADTIDISAVNTAEHLRKTLSARKYDVALLDMAFIGEADYKSINLPLFLRSEQDTRDTSAPCTLPGASIRALPIKHIQKHQRISRAVAGILEEYATANGNIHILGEKMRSVTAVWSPAGGVGKTTVALSYAEASILKERDAFYLDLEDFSSALVYFDEDGKSISKVFEMLERNDGNVKMYIQGIASSKNGIKYLCAPDNFDDISILSADNTRELVICCAETAGELVVDLPCACNEVTRQVFDLADKVLLVTDRSETAQTKLAQFITQNCIYENINEKVTLVINKDTQASGRRGGLDPAIKTQNAIKANSAIKTLEDSAITLPYVEKHDAQSVCRELAAHGFGMYI